MSDIRFLCRTRWFGLHRTHDGAWEHLHLTVRLPKGKKFHLHMALQA